MFRDLILGKKKETEVFIREMDAETLSTMISFIYTGDFNLGDYTDIKNLVKFSDKYEIKGFMELLCFKMKGNVKNHFIADMLIASDRSGPGDLGVLDEKLGILRIFDKKKLGILRIWDRKLGILRIWDRKLGILRIFN